MHGFKVLLLVCIIWCVAVDAKRNVGRRKKKKVDKTSPEWIVNELRNSPAAQISQKMMAHSLEHEPFIKFDAHGGAFVAVRGLQGSTRNLHPQEKVTEDTLHRITDLWVEDQDKNIIFHTDLKDNNVSPKAEFTIPEGATKLVPHCHCYIHGVYEGPTYVVEWERKTLALMKTLRKKPKEGPISFHPGKEDEPVKHEPWIHIETITLDENHHMHRLSMGVRGEGGSEEEKHPQTPEHFVKAMYVRDHHDAIVFYQEYDGTEGESPTVKDLDLPVLTRFVKGYEYCNKHGLWVTPKIMIAHPDDKFLNEEIPDEVLAANKKQIEEAMRKGAKPLKVEL